MSDWHPFAATNEPGTCLWCGRKLRRKTVMDDEATARGHADGSLQRYEWATRPAEKLGDYQDDSFCGLRCGYQFGAARAELGDRLQRRGG